MIPRLRIFAGPNGSGKTTLAQWLSSTYSVNLYHFVNADILFAEISENLRTACPFPFDAQRLLDFARESSFPENEKTLFLNGGIHVEDEFVLFEPEAITSYTVALLAEFYHAEYVDMKENFSFETVFSHVSKIDILKKARQEGYRTYLYFIATNDPEMNVSRVESRVKHGGHNVPADKIVSRYYRSIENAAIALPYVNRAYFFDNSRSEPILFAESDEGTMHFYTDAPPRWFENVFQALP